MRLFVLLHLFGVICGAMRIENDLKIPRHHVSEYWRRMEKRCVLTRFMSRFVYSFLSAISFHIAFSYFLNLRVST